MRRSALLLSLLWPKCQCKMIRGNSWAPQEGSILNSDPLNSRTYPRLQRRCRRVFNGFHTAGLMRMVWAVITNRRAPKVARGAGIGTAKNKHQGVLPLGAMGGELCFPPGRAPLWIKTGGADQASPGPTTAAISGTRGRWEIAEEFSGARATVDCRKQDQHCCRAATMNQPCCFKLPNAWHSQTYLRQQSAACPTNAALAGGAGRTDQNYRLAGYGGHQGGISIGLTSTGHRLALGVPCCFPHSGCFRLRPGRSPGSYGDWSSTTQAAASSPAHQARRGWNSGWSLGMPGRAPAIPDRHPWLAGVSSGCRRFFAGHWANVWRIRMATSMPLRRRPWRAA